MKAPSRASKLAEHRAQALDYWRESSDVEQGIEAPRYVVLCAFQRFEVWQPATRYVNGELFAHPAKLQLDAREVALLARACEFDWRKVNPTIFGSLLEGVLGERRRELGTHYTHEVDILKIVEPSIVRPWIERIEATTTPGQARELLDELCAFRVLDPACGCGNFLDVAYRELRKLEHDLKERIRSLSGEQGMPLPSGPWPYVPLANMLGLDIERVAVLIARVTLWMGHRQMIELFGEAEPPLPLVDLSGVRVADALRVPWPETDAIVGNPPFLGSQLIRRARGDAYIDWLQRTFGVGVKDPDQLPAAYMLGGAPVAGITAELKAPGLSASSAAALPADKGRCFRTSGFATFPWPSPTTEAQRKGVAAASVGLLARQHEICCDRQIGLTTLYNDVDAGAHRDLTALHRQLDEAVADCYGWPKSVAQDDGVLVGLLLELNAQFVPGDRSYDPFGEH